VNPYVSFGLAMCLVLGLSLFLTAYLAVMFNRRAKADMLRTLTPLADLLGGEVELEEARASGRFAGHIADGRAANSLDGPGKVFLISIIDGAGGSKWSYTARRPKDATATVEAKFEGPDGDVGDELNARVAATVAPLMTNPGWVRVEYDPVPGHVQLTRPMVTRRDIPDADAFERQLELLVEIAESNRALQQPAT
jgi:hypothetical protein